MKPGRVARVRKGFTLVELSVVIVIIAILSGVSTTAYWGFANYVNSKSLTQSANALRLTVDTKTSGLGFGNGAYRVTDQTSSASNTQGALHRGVKMALQNPGSKDLLTQTEYRFTGQKTGDGLLLTKNGIFGGVQYTGLNQTFEPKGLPDISKWTDASEVIAALNDIQRSYHGIRFHDQTVKYYGALNPDGTIVRENGVDSYIRVYTKPNTEVTTKILITGFDIRTTSSSITTFVSMAASADPARADPVFPQKRENVNYHRIMDEVVVNQNVSFTYGLKNPDTDPDTKKSTELVTILDPDLDSLLINVFKTGFNIRPVMDIRQLDIVLIKNQVYRVTDFDLYLQMDNFDINGKERPGVDKFQTRMDTPLITQRRTVLNMIEDPYSSDLYLTPISDPTRLRRISYAFI